MTSISQLIRDAIRESIEADTQVVIEPPRGMRRQLAEALQAECEQEIGTTFCGITCDGDRWSVRIAS